MVLRGVPEGGECHYGFFATRMVRAENARVAAERATALVKEEARAIAAADINQVHAVHVVKVEAMGLFDHRPPGGFTFFPDEADA